MSEPSAAPPGPTEAEKDILHDAEQRLLRDCMGAEWARQHGYGSDLERRREETRWNDPNQRYFRSPQPPTASDRPDGEDARQPAAHP
ncbi:hypothetical protein FGW37_00730 [Streptomyces rectiverticillatus]|uniref:hypothetical protein n=1 Tax=Streptomyces rectiverticillatus TaxID=173860 RepID=UPI0015C3297B|nr:hypothetical protein [Streptomyces rectiverticillatus]QLE70326.1 hypothetical protein FGW37_00730 [Streptomyces rectiverticillatus]